MKRLAVLILIPLALLVSCPSPLHEDHAAPGTVTVSVATGSAARTVVPDYVSAIATIEVSLVSNNGYGTLTQSDSASPWQVAFTDVPAGNWDIDVIVRNAVAVQIGSGHAPGQTLAPGAGLTVPITVTFSTSATTGAVSFTVTFPSSTNIDYVSGTIEETGAVSTPPVVNNAGTGSATLEFSGLPTGTYSLVMTFKRSGTPVKTAGVFREKIVEAAGFTSGLWVASDGSLLPQRAFSSDDFYDTSTLLGNLVVSGGVLPSSSFSSGNTGYLQGVFGGLTSVTVTASTSVAGQYLQYRWNNGSPIEIIPNIPSLALTLIDKTAEVGTDNTLQVIVTAPDQQSTTTYTVQFSKGYTVTFNANGATGGTAPTDGNLHEAGQAVQVPGSGTLANSGYTFVGWNTAADGSGTSYSEGGSLLMPAANLTLYAAWNKQVNGTTVINPPPVYTVTINGPSTLQYGSQTIFTSGYTGTPSAYAWYLDFSTSPVSTGSTFTIIPTVSTCTFGGHLLMLVVTDVNGLSYAESVAIWVQN